MENINQHEFIESRLKEFSEARKLIKDKRSFKWFSILIPVGLFFIFNKWGKEYSPELLLCLFYVVFIYFDSELENERKRVNKIVELLDVENKLQQQYIKDIVEINEAIKKLE